MSEIRVSAHRDLVASPAVVYRCLADYRRHHPNILPPAFSDFRVESGGIGAGTETSFTVNAGGRERRYRMRVSEPEPGRVLTETDRDSSLVTTFTVTPAGTGCTVRIETRWQGAGGIGGFFERAFAPRAVRKLYADELERLDSYSRTLPQE